MKNQSSKIFNFVRGAVRTVYGIEDFRGKVIVISGMDIVGQELLTMFCFDDVKLLFHTPDVISYSKAHLICNSIKVMKPEKVYNEIDIFIDLIHGTILVGDNSRRRFPIEEIGNDPYNQGIHEYYL